MDNLKELKKIYEIIEKESEILDGSFHIIPYDNDFDITTYRIYHESGYCIIVSREYICEPEEINDYDIHNLNKDGYFYNYDIQWEKEKIKNSTELLKLIKKWIKK